MRAAPYVRLTDPQTHPQAFSYLQGKFLGLSDVRAAAIKRNAVRTCFDLFIRDVWGRNSILLPQSYSNTYTLRPPCDSLLFSCHIDVKSRIVLQIILWIKCIKIWLPFSTALIALVPCLLAASIPPQNPSLVVVPGAWHSPQHFSLVQKLLEQAGYSVPFSSKSKLQRDQSKCHICGKRCCIHQRRCDSPVA